MLQNELGRLRDGQATRDESVTPVLYDLSNRLLIAMERARKITEAVDGLHCRIYGGGEGDAGENKRGTAPKQVGAVHELRDAVATVEAVVNSLDDSVTRLVAGNLA